MNLANNKELGRKEIKARDMLQEILDYNNTKNREGIIPQYDAKTKSDHLFVSQTGKIRLHLIFAILHVL